MGAGPGDPELVTLRGARALMCADAVLYDALVDPELLRLAPDDAVRMCVGKRAGKHSYSQEGINDLLVEAARRHGHVVRLKGGDPFVFGRVHEELSALAVAGIQAEVVPGITSAIAAPQFAGIPLTLRGVAESFWVITATTADGSVPADLHTAARSNATVVILKGIGKIDEIANAYSLAGRDSLPFAVVQNVSLAAQRLATGEVADMPRIVAEAGLRSPAVIIVGEVVRHRVAPGQYLHDGAMAGVLAARTQQAGAVWRTL